MIEGTLLINLDPPYMAFTPKVSGQSINGGASDNIRCDCTQAQIKDLLVELDVISPYQQWPLRECILRLPVVLPAKILAKHGLLNTHNLEPFAAPNTRLLRRIS